MSALPPRSEAPPAPTAAPTRDIGRQPRSLVDRLRLGLILLVLPGVAVCIPVLISTHFFGQRPRPKTPPAVETNGLQQSLERSADNLLPSPSALGPDALVVTVRADHLAARLKKISDQAQAFGGSASEGLSTATEKRLSIELPAGRADAFRGAVSSNAPVGPVPPTPSAGPTTAGKDFVEIVIRAAGEDE